MIPRTYLLASIFGLFVSLALLAGGAHAQGILNKTDFGKSQNTPEDLQNSLIPGKPNLTKGEKKSEVDPKTLQSKPMKDPTFEGGLNDLGIDWRAGDKIGKLHGSQSSNSTEASSKASNSSGATEKDATSAARTSVATEKDSTASKAAGSGSKEQKAEASKASESQKTSAAKTDGDH